MELEVDLLRFYFFITFFFFLHNALYVFTRLYCQKLRLYGYNLELGIIANDCVVEK